MALNINIHTPNGLVPISPELTYQLIVDVLGYTPLDVSNYVTYDSISEADDSAFYVVDSQLHILAQIDEDGLQAAIMTVNGKDVESGLIYDIKELADDAFYIVDSQSNVIAKIGENGLETTNVIALSIITNNIESSDSELYIVDTNNKPILSVDANGLETTNVIAVDAVLSLHSVVDHIEDYEIHITEEERQSWNNKSKFDSISEDDNTTLYINDKNNKTIAKFDADGLTVTNVSTNDVTVGGNESVLSHINNSSVHITDTERTTWNTVTSKASKTELSEHINDTDKHLGDEISLDDNTTLYINDKDNKTIVKVNSEGLTAAEVILQSDKELHSLLEHVTNTDIHIQDGERESWNAKIDSSTLTQKLAEKTDKTDFNEHVQDTNLHIGDEITLDDNTTLYINDAGGNVIAKFDASGLNVGDLFLNNQHVATEEYVNGKVTGLFEFKGSISSNAEVPAVHEVGDTYRITANGEYAGKTCEEGDMLVCIVNGSTANNEDWTVLQQNWTAVDGSSTLKWGEAVTLATIGGVTIDAKLPAISSITSKIATGTNGSTNNATTEVTDPYINHVEGSVVNSSVQFKGANTATVKAKNGVITIDSGVTSGEKDKWDEVVNKVDTSVYNAGQAALDASIDKLFEDKVDKSVYNTDKTALNKTILDISTELGTKANQTDFEEHINDTDLHLGDEISLIDNTALYVNDKDGKTIIRVDSKGLTAANISTNEVIVNGKSVVELIDNTSLHINNDDVHLVDGERTKWNTVVNKVDTSVYNAGQDAQNNLISKLFTDKVDTSVYNADKTTLNKTISDISTKVGTKASQTDFEEHINDTDLHLGGEISLEDDSTLYITDKDGKIIVRVDEDGLAASNLFIDDKEVATKEYVNGKVTGLFEFKGSISSSTGVPAVHEVGDAYRINKAGEYAGNTCEKGDMLVCIADGSTANNTDWTVLQQNWTAVDGSSTLKWGEAVTLATIGGVNIDAKLPDNPDTTYKPGTGLDLVGTTFNHKNSIAAGTAAGGSGLLDYEGTIQIPSITYDSEGHITDVSTTSYILPVNSNVTSKIVTGTNSSSTSNTTTEVSNPYINHVEGSVVNSSLQIVGANTATVKAKNGVITIDSGVTSDEKKGWNKVTDKLDTSVYNEDKIELDASIAALFRNKVDTSVYNKDKIELDASIDKLFADKVDTSVYNKDKIELDASIAALFRNKVDISVYNAGQNAQNSSISDISIKVGTKANQTDFEEHITNTDLHLGDEISLEDDSTLYISDKDGKIIAKFTQSGFDAKLIRQDDNVVASNVIVDASIDTPYIDEDGTLHLTPGVLETNTNTTYRFTSGTNKFTVATSDGSVYDVSVTPSITVSASGNGDGVVNLTGTPGTNGVSFSATHAKKGPKKPYMRQNNPTSVSSGTTTLWIPQIAVDDYGHVTDASNASVAITIPTVIKGDSVTDATAGTSTDSGEYTITPITFKVGDTDLQPVNVKAKHGSDGKSISSVTLKSGDGTAGTTNEYSVKVDTTEVGTFNVYQGKDFKYEDFTDEQLEALTGPKGDQGLTIKGAIEPSKRILQFPPFSKINDAYVVSRDALSGEFPENAKKGDLWVCVKASELICDGEKCMNTEPVFNFSGVNLCGPAGKDGTSVTIKGSKDTEGELPEEGNTNGDGYIVLGILFVWDGTKWTEAGEIKGPKGDPGPQGVQGFTIIGEISSPPNLDKLTSNLSTYKPKINDAWIVKHNLNDSQLTDVGYKNGAVWVYRGDNYVSQTGITYGPFEYITNLRGPQGPAGEYTSGTNIDITNNVISAKGYIFDKAVNSFAEGSHTRANGNNSHAEGGGTESAGSESHAEGYESHAKGDNSHSEGYKTTATGKSSHAEGNGVEAVGQASHAEGWHNIESTNGSMYTVYQDETDNTKYWIVYDFRGSTGPTGGSDEVFYLKHGMTFFYNNKYYCVTEVFYDETNPNNPTSFRLNQSIGRTDTSEFGITLILGKSIGKGSHIEGCNTIAYEDYSHAEGNSTRAAGDYSHTEGVETCAVGSASHAEGHSSVAVGVDSHAEGCNTRAVGAHSHAEGIYNIADGYAAHAEGTRNKATNNYEHAQGYFNISNTGSDPKNQTISSIGIGHYTGGTESPYNEEFAVRKNAVEVMRNGDVYIHGIGDYNGTNSVVEEGVVKAKTLQDCINENTLPKKENELIYFNEENGFISSPLMYSEGLVVDNEEDLEYCQSNAETSLSTVLSSWTAYGSSESDRNDWGYCDSIENDPENPGKCIVTLVGKDSISVPLFKLNGEPQDYIFNTTNTGANTGFFTPKKYSNYDVTVCVGSFNTDINRGHDYLGNLIAINSQDSSNLESDFYGISLHTLLLYPDGSDGVFKSRPNYAENIKNSTPGVYDMPGSTIQITAFKQTNLNSEDSYQSHENNIPILSISEGLKIVPLKDYDAEIHGSSGNSKSYGIQSRVIRKGDIFIIYFSEAYRLYEDDDITMVDDSNYSVDKNRSVIIDLSNYTLKYTYYNGDEVETVTKEFEKGLGTSYINPAGKNTEYTDNQIESIRTIFDEINEEAHRGFESKSTANGFFRYVSGFDEKILDIRTEKNCVYKFENGNWNITGENPFDLLKTGSRLALNKKTNKLFYNDGLTVYQIADISGSNRNNIQANQRPSSYSTGDNIDITEDLDISVTGMPQVYEEGDNITLENTTNDEGKSVLKINGLSTNALTYNPERRSIALQYNEEDSSYNEAQADYSVVMGWNNKAIREETDGAGLTLQAANSFVGGMDNRVYHSNCIVFGEGLYTQFGNTFVLGKYNGTVSNQAGWGDAVLGIVGDGYKDANGNVTGRNVLLLQGGSDPALHCRGGFKNNASLINDFGEYFEWLDGNPDNEDRIGYMVQLNGDKIELTTSLEKCIGVISGTTGFIGGGCAFEWHNKFLHDKWGREIIGEDGNPIINPDYNPDLEYIPREQRKEWDVVGLVGQVITRQDGTLEVGGYAGCSNGIATNATSGFKVLKIIDSETALLLVK